MVKPLQASFYDHILLIGFGGPRSADEVPTFLQKVAQGRNIPDGRLKEVVHHYELIGGTSPYNEEVFSLQKNLQASLADYGIHLPVFYGMKNWHPFLFETLKAIKAQGFTRGLGIVLAPHRSEASFERYLQSLNEAIKETANSTLSYEILNGWHDHPLFIAAHAESLKELRANTPPASENPHLLFTAHSIPVTMAEQCKYAQEFETSSALIAQALNLSSWSCAYQSRSGNPKAPWLGPDVLEKGKELAKDKIRSLLVVPIGFLINNAEILYDLDIELQEKVQSLGITYFRSPTIPNHPLFLQMLTQMIKSKAAKPSPMTPKPHMSEQ